MTSVLEAAKHIRKHLKPIRPRAGRIGHVPVLRIECSVLELDYVIQQGTWCYRNIPDEEFFPDPPLTPIFSSGSTNARLTVFIAFQIGSASKAILSPSDPMEHFLSKEGDPVEALKLWNSATMYLDHVANGRRFAIGSARREAASYLDYLSNSD